VVKNSKKAKKQYLFLWYYFKQASLAKKAIILFVFLIIAGVIIFQVQRATNKPNYLLEKAQKTDITETVSESGNISTDNSVPIYSPATGFITDVYVKNGSQVYVGENLFSVESSASEQEKESVLANYLMAKTLLDSAESNKNLLRSEMYAKWKIFTDMSTTSTYERSDKTPNEENRKAAEFQIAQDNWLSAEKKFKDQETVVAQARAQASSTWILYQATQNTTVTSPADGTIANLSVATGNSVTAHTTSTLNPVLSILKFAKYEAVIPMGEEDIIKVKEGQNATLSIDAIPNKTYKGTVSRLDTIGTKNQGVTSFNVYISLENDDASVHPGMSLDADIITKRLPSIVSVPNASVKPYKGGKAVRILKNNEVVYIPIEIGVVGKERTQILKGIQEGQEVIVALPNEQLKRSGFLSL